MAYVCTLTVRGGSGLIFVVSGWAQTHTLGSGFCRFKNLTKNLGFSYSRAEALLSK
jgi:hypothetical protein